MFKAIINSSPLVNDAANNFFQNIYGDSFAGDISFVSTLRALVAPRMTPEDGLSLRFGSSSYTASQVGSNSDSVMTKTICEYFYPADRGSIYIHHMNSDIQEDNYACLELIKSTFGRIYKGWHRLEKVTDFYRKQFFVLCYINPELKSVAIFSDKLDIRKMHYLQCSIFAFLPWYFNPDEGVSEDEMALINSLREKTSTKYEEAIAKIAERYDFRTAKIRQLLSDFETKYERLECESVRSQIRDVISTINSLNSQIGEYLSAKNDMEIKLLGLEQRIADGSGDSEIMEYFLCNDKLVLFEVTDERMVFAVKSYLTYFDEEMALSAINNKSSYIYRPNGRGCNNIIPAEQMEKLMRAIFIDQLLKVRFCAAYEFNLNGSVNAKQHFNFGHEFKDYMPNTHIDGYRCMGNYQQAINQLLMNRDYISAIEQCVASSKSLNFGDSTVMKTFMSALYGISDHRYNNKCIELPDGSIVTPKEAVEWIEEQECGDNE